MHDFTTLNNFFDHIYVVTLHRANERQDEIKKNLAGLNYDFFWGADKQEHSIVDMERDGIYNEALTKKNHRYHKALSCGQICCAWSHRNVYEDVLSKGYRKVLILEDDVTAISNIGTIFSLMLTELPSNWELLYLDYNKNESANKLKQYWYHVQKLMGKLNWSHTTIQHLYPKKIGNHLSSAGYHDFTSAYAITPIVAEKLLNLQTPIAYLADNLLAKACTSKLVNGLIVKPKLFRQLSQGLETNIHSFVDD